MANGIAPAAVAIGLAAILTLGLVAAWLARLTAGSRRQAVCHGLFFGLLTLVGMATAVALWLRPGLWLVSGATLATMVVAATCEFGRRKRAAAW